MEPISPNSLSDQFTRTLTLGSNSDNSDAYSDGGEFEFFAGAGDPTSPASAEDLFLNGQIRSLSSISAEIDTKESSPPPVSKIFVASSSEYCAWSPDNSPESSQAPEMKRKSNSTGFSKLWRVREMMSRSHSDGEDAFVFLKNSSSLEKVAPKMTTAPLKEKKKKKEKKGEERQKAGKAYEELYGKGDKKGKSYLPYRQDLVGFFTNASGLSRNVHPY